MRRTRSSRSDQKRNSSIAREVSRRSSRPIISTRRRLDELAATLDLPPNGKRTQPRPRAVAAPVVSLGVKQKEQVVASQPYKKPVKKTLERHIGLQDTKQCKKRPSRTSGNGSSRPFAGRYCKKG